MRTDSPRLDSRLASAAAFVRGGRLADVGTDHAYLPAFLLLEGKLDRALASDINEGPLESARETLGKYRLLDRAELLLSDGLHGVEAFRPNDITILGMGGELIASIIDAAPWVKDKKIRLILQPMTKRAELRAHLLASGFEIEDEAASEADGRIYQTLCVSYSGTVTKYDTAELLIGRANIRRGDGITKRYTEQLINIYSARKNAKASSGVPTGVEDEVLGALCALNYK